VAPDQDAETLGQWVTGLSPTELVQLRMQLTQAAQACPILLDELGGLSNRWFAEELEAQARFSSLKDVLPSHDGAAPGCVEFKDSNGTPLNEGDSVLVIKDLKVKGYIVEPPRRIVKIPRRQGLSELASRLSELASELASQLAEPSD
jgi:hypothetical protein